MSVWRPTVSVVLLSYNRPQLLPESLSSAAGQNHVSNELVVVDNHSPASSEIAEIVARYSRARLIANDKNLGFTGGMNAGIRAASGSYICLMEDDIVLAPGSLAKLAAYMDGHPEVGIAGAIMLNRASRTVRCAGGELSLGTRYVKRIFSDADSNRFLAPYFVTYLPGAFLFIRRDVLDRLGGFRKDFFMYFEDDEFCLRVLEAGWRIAVVPQTHVEHFEPGPMPSPGWLEYMKLRNFFRLYFLHAPLMVLPSFLLRYFLLDTSRSACTGQRRFLWLLRAGLNTLLCSPILLRDRWHRLKTLRCLSSGGPR